MRVLKKSLVALAVLTGILFLLTYPKVYVVRGSGGGELYWNADEALLFMGSGVQGAHMSYLRYAIEPLLETGSVAARPPDDEHCSQVVVVRVTDKEIGDYDADLGCVADYDVSEGHIYAVEWPRLWKWSGTNFDAATPEEARAFVEGRVAETAAASAHPWEFDNIDGWSMRVFNETPYQHQLVLNGQAMMIVFHGETWPQRPLSVDLFRPGQSPQTIWSFDGRPRLVSKREYQTIFGNH
jgi:hypothetical protein